MLPVGLACLALVPQDRSVPDYRTEQETGKELEFWRIHKPRWEIGDFVLQGFLGANLYETVERTGGGSPDVDGSGEDASQLPVIGGGGQLKLAGETVDAGLEFLFSFSGRADATAFAAGGGGAVIAVDVDMILFEVYGGPFVSFPFENDARAYVGAGPMMQWADFSQESDAAGIDDSGTGFGTGFYARAGIEFRLGESSMIGFGARWAESTVDLDNDLGTLELDGVQVVLTISEGL